MSRQIARRLADEACDDRVEDIDVLAQVQAEAAATWRSPHNGKPTVRGVERLRARCEGFSLHAGVVIAYRLKRPWPDGRTELVLPPVTFLRRLCGIIPPPHRHLVRYAGSTSTRRGSGSPAGSKCTRREARPTSARAEATGCRLLP